MPRLRATDYTLLPRSSDTSNYSDEVVSDVKPVQTLWWTRALAASAMFISMVLFAVAIIEKDSLGLHQTSHLGLVQELVQHSSGSNIVPISFNLSNDYTKAQPITWSSWEHLAEPHRTTTLQALCNGVPCDSNLGVYVWDISSSSGSIDPVSLSGASSEYTFKATGRYSVELTITTTNSLDATELQHVVGDVMVKYVRREIRSLTDEDRNRFLDALHVLYFTSQKEGVRTYGPAYVSMDSFVAKHLEGAGALECDHWHDDAGIMTHHLGFTLEMEQSLQTVDPTVSVPYWEYSLDAHLYNGAIQDSPVWLDDWLGPMSPASEGYVVDKGRWAHTPVANDAWDKVHNPYGLLRSPWNVDPTPYLRRHDTVMGKVGFFTPTCSTLDGCFGEKSIQSLNNCLNGAAHGPIHILVGGEWGHPNETLGQAWGFHGKLVLIAKALWRRGYLRLPEDKSCSTTSSCVSSCPAEVLAAHGKTPYDVLLETEALKWIAPGTRGEMYYDDVTKRYVVSGAEPGSAEEADAFQSLLDALCNTGSVGEMFTSSAPQDPSFWVIHPTAERLLGWRRLAAEGKGGWQGSTLPLDEKWGYEHRGDVGDTGVVCDWENVKAATDLPTCVRGTCSGHGAADILPFLLTPSGADSPRSFTNEELYAWLHPLSEDLPYMYDSYTWDHCIEEGYAFDGTVKSSPIHPPPPPPGPPPSANIS